MNNINQNLAVHINHLNNEDPVSVRAALNWLSQSIQPVSSLHLLHLKVHIPTHTLCSSAAEQLFN